MFMAYGIKAQMLLSPSKELSLDFKLAANGAPSYTVTYKNKPVILASMMCIYLKEETDLASGFEIASTSSNTFSGSWKPVLGEQSRHQ